MIDFGDWGLGIGDWGLGQSPIPNPQSPENEIFLKFFRLYLFTYLSISYTYLLD